MGYDQKRYTILARVSRHNSEQDCIDDREWNNLVQSIIELIENDAEYRRIVYDWMETA